MKQHSLQVALVQRAPAFLDLEESLNRVDRYVDEAVAGGAQCVIFGECWLSGYPAWLDHVPGVALWDHEPTKRVYARMLEESFVLNSPTQQRLAEAARRQGCYLIIGVNETVEGGSSLYNSLLSFGPDGSLLNHHRKLMPTFTEKLLYTTGDAAGLRSIDTPHGKIGGLICWEHWMPLTRQALHDDGEAVHIAVWPAVQEAHQLGSRHYAFEGRCYVVAVGQILRVADLPSEFELPVQLQNEPGRLLLNGGSAVIGPNGAYCMDPVFDQEGTFHYRIDTLRQCAMEKLSLDVSGHYQRPDVFELKVNRMRRDEG